MTNSRKDISSREDLERLLRAFYEKVFDDEVIGTIFTDVMKVDLEKHVPVITDFWETVLLNADSYHKNAIAVHMHINEKFPLEEKHFTRWLKLFNETIDDLFDGDVTETAKQRALSIATIMKVKMANARKGIV
jgi:hemoglobin